MSAANERKETAEIVELGDARAQRAAAGPTLDTAGAMLRAAREDAGYTVQDVADEINVKPERLDAIERMDLAALPTAPYTLGFVRAYAGFLGLPVEPLVARFREEAAWSRPATAPTIAPPPSLGRDREVGLAGVLIVAVFIVWALWQIIGGSPGDESTELPSGFPIADRTEVPQVVPEVTTNLEDDLTRVPPVRVDADAPAPAETPAALANAGVPVTEPAPLPSAAADQPAATTGGAAEQRTANAPLVPLVLAAPLGEEAVPETEPEASAPVRTAADALNERLLEEVMAASEPGRSEPSAAPSEAAGPAERRVVAAPAITEAAPRELAGSAAPAAARAPVAAEAAPEPPERIAATLVDPVAPVYPRRCRRTAEDQEVVTVRFGVSRTGRVISPGVESSTNRCFDDAALSAVSRFGFEPASEGGRAVAESGRISRIVFQKP